MGPGNAASGKEHGVKKIYLALFSVKDLYSSGNEWLKEHTRHEITSVSYISALYPLSRFHMHRALFAFSCESLESRPSVESEPSDTSGDNALRKSRSYAITPSGRYAHSRGYVEDVAQASGWRVLRIQGEVIRYNAGQPVQGHLCVLQLASKI